MDDMVGQILDELDRQGLADDTWVIYTSDHGESLGEHGLFYKQCSYEGSVGVPLVIRGPEIPRGREVSDPVTLVDLFPTVLDMAGLDWRTGRPGVSWLPLARGENHARPDYAFSEFHGNFFRHDWYMLVRGRHKYTYYSGERPSLFDVVADPLENEDIAGRPENAGLLRDFEKTLRTIVDPEEVSLRARRELGLIGPGGEDYTETLTVARLLEGRDKGLFPGEPAPLPG
jgi:choline-sulfatase